MVGETPWAATVTDAVREVHERRTVDEGGVKEGKKEVPKDFAKPTSPLDWTYDRPHP